MNSDLRSNNSVVNSINDNTLDYLDNSINNDNNDDNDGNISDENVDINEDDNDDNINNNEYDNNADEDSVSTNEQDISVGNVADADHVDNLSNNNGDDTSSVNVDNADNDANYNDHNNNSNNDDNSMDTPDNNDYDEATSIPKELRSNLRDGTYWSTNDRPSYATVAARNNNGIGESNNSTIGGIIAHRSTAMNRTLGLISGPYERTIFNIRDKV